METPILKLPVFLHVNIQAGFLGVGGVAELTPIGLLPRVDPLVGLEVVLAGEVLAAHRALVRGLPQVALAVDDPQVALEELLGAVLALELPAADVLELAVAEHGALGGVGLAAEVAHEGVRSRGGAVLVGLVAVQAGLDGEHGAADVALVFLEARAGLAVGAQQVQLQPQRLGELGAAQLAQLAALVDLEQVAAVLLGQLAALGAQGRAGGRAVRADAHVVSHLQPRHALGAAVKTSQPALSVVHLLLQIRERDIYKQD